MKYFLLLTVFLISACTTIKKTQKPVVHKPFRSVEASKPTIIKSSGGTIIHITPPIIIKPHITTPVIIK
jgi:hypothetical protein